MQTKTKAFFLSLSLGMLCPTAASLTVPTVAHAEVALAAKKAPKKKNTAAKATKKRKGSSADKGTGAPTAMPVSSAFAPLFRTPAAPPAWMAGDFVGRDQSIIGEMNFTRQAAATRAAQIRQTESDFRLQKPGSPQASQLGSSLVRLYEEQCLYLENIRGLGLSDPTYSDLNHFTKTLRSSLVTATTNMLRQFPSNDARAHWKATQLISRIKIGDPSAARDALAFVRQDKSDDGRRVMMVGIAWDAMAGRHKGAFGSIESALELELDAASRAAFKLFQAEAYAKVNSSRTTLAYEDAAKEGTAIRTPEGGLGPVSQRGAAKMVESALRQRPDAADPDLVASLQSIGLTDTARYYVEQVALRSVAKQPQRAMRSYADILQIGDLTADLTVKIEFRVLDIALAARDPISTESQWKRIADLQSGLRTPGVEPRAAATQNFLWGQVQKGPNGENVDRFVRLHDLFAPAIASYGANEDWSLRVMEGLWRIKRASDTAARGDTLAASSKRPEVKLAALRFSARARESILGISPEPSYARRSKAAGDGEVLTPYVATLDKLAPLVQGDESERSIYQGAYLTHNSGGTGPGRARFDDAFGRYPRSKYAAGGISYLLGDAQANKDWAGVEKYARLAESKRIKPSEKRHADLRSLVETAVYEQAVSLAAEQQYEASANKFVAFQKEFPSSKKADTALDTAARNYILAKKVDLAVGTMERLLGAYPKSGYAKETRWQAAEQSKGLGQMLRAANHYEAFARSYSAEGRQRQAWIKAAEMHKGLGRYSSAIADYEMSMKDSGSNEEKVKIAKDIAEMQFKYGKSTEALAAYDRVIKISKNPDDEIWARAQMIEVFMRLSQETNARAMISRVLDLKPVSQDGFKTLARAKFSLARLEARDVKEVDPMREADLRKAVDGLLKRYDRIKGLYLAPCEVPGLELCSVGYYETARLAELLAGKLLEVELPPTLDPKEVTPIRALVKSGSGRLSADSKSFAIQAEDSLSSGAPDADTADRIRSYAQQQRGDVGGEIPLK